MEAGIGAYRREGCDFVVSFGGGTPHDAAKAIALLATNEGPALPLVSLLQFLEKICDVCLPIQGCL